jgi:hypothetical protein
VAASSCPSQQFPGNIRLEGRPPSWVLAPGPGAIDAYSPSSFTLLRAPSAAPCPEECCWGRVNCEDCLGSLEGLVPGQPLLTPTRMCCASMRLVPGSGSLLFCSCSHCHFQLSQEDQTSNIYTPAFNSERTSDQHNERRISQTVFLDLPLNNVLCNLQSFLCPT